MRYLQPLPLDQRTTHERLVRRCFIDYDRELALVADYKNSGTGEHELLGVGRLNRISTTRDARFTLVISDYYHGEGLGSKLLEMLVKIAQKENYERIIGAILPENTSAQHLCEKIGFTLTREGSIVKAERKL
jgi:acetyltransferase